MPETDLENMEIQELKSLIASAEAVLARKVEGQRANFMSEMKARAEELGLDFDEMIKVRAPRGRARARGSALAPKYRHPENPDLTWSGRGRMPAWVKEFMNAGKEDEIRIKE